MTNDTEYILRSPVMDTVFPEIDVYNYLLTSEGFSEKQDRLALVNTDNGRRFTFHQLKVAVDNTASFLREVHQFDFGDKLAFYCPNQSEHVIVMLAVWKLGGVVVLVNHMLGKEEVLYELSLTSARYIFCGLDQAKTVKGIRETFELKAILVNGSYESFISATSAFTYKSTTKDTSCDIVIKPKEHTAAIFFSSGTTGKPKGVETTHFNIVVAIISRSAPKTTISTEHMVTFQPLSHCYGNFVTLAMVAGGCTSWLMPKYDMETYLKLVSTLKVSVLQVVPPIAVQMVNNENTVRKYDLSCVKDFRNGSAICPPGIERQLLEILPQLKYIRQGYGLTETSAGITVTPKHEDLKIPLSHIKGKNQIGMLRENVEMKVVDPDSGRSVGPNTTGELCFRCPQLMKGYYNNPRATAEVIDKEGWFHTGDLGYYDEYEFIYIVDRLKELIKYKGLQVPPAEIEDLILELEGIADVAVIGQPDIEAGELPMAFVVRKKGCHVTEVQIIGHVAEHVAPFKRLRAGVRFIPSIPKSTNGKVLRRVLRDQLLNNTSKL